MRKPKSGDPEAYQKYKDYQKAWYHSQSPEKRKAIAVRVAQSRRLHYKNTVRWDLIKQKYGLTEAEYNSIKEKQGGRCAICFGLPTDTNMLAVDHCHKTGKVRGLIHRRCNTGMGMFDDDAIKLSQAVDYLRRTGGF